MFNFSYSDKIVVVNNLLFQELTDGESVFLNLQNEQYFGLDAVGTDMWKYLTDSEDIQTAFDNLLLQYDVDENILKQDLNELINKLLENGLVQISEK